MQQSIRSTIHSIHRQLRSLFSDKRAELDEKAILIAFFVIVVASAVGILGTRISGLFSRLANMF
jgi:hypothetical protein